MTPQHFRNRKKKMKQRKRNNFTSAPRFQIKILSISLSSEKLHDNNAICQLLTQMNV